VLLRYYRCRTQLNDRAPIRSIRTICALSAVAALSVLALSLAMQWLIYADWLREKDPLRIVGTTLAAALTFAFAFRWQLALRERRLRMVARLGVIGRMNDRIRNALQQIECITYLKTPDVTEPVRQAADAIDAVLREVLLEMGDMDRSEHRASSARAAPQGRTA